MAHELAEDLFPMSTLLPQLTSALAEATAVVEVVDDFLADELPVGPWVASRPFDTQRAEGEDGRELLITSHLACGRVAGKYRLNVLNVTLDRAEAKDQFTQIIDEERTLWLACTREIRLQSFAMLPELLSQLSARIFEITAQTNKTSETVRELLRSMGRLPVSRSSTPAPVALVGALDDQSDEESELVTSGFLVNPLGDELFKRPRMK